MLGRTVARQTALVARSTPQKLILARNVHVENTVYNVGCFYARSETPEAQLFLFLWTEHAL
jgi:hypothetical protein